MEAAVMREYGGPSVLGLERHPDPAPRAGWATVRLQASALNWHDVLVRRGTYKSPLPHVPGADGAGIRLDTGEPVMILPSLHWGQRQAAPGPDWQILGDSTPGTYAELVSVPEECLFPRPEGYDALQAAAFPLVGVTAYRALFTRGRLTTGESVLVLGAGGGLAPALVSMGAALGASMFVTSSSEDKIQKARTLGAVDGVLHFAPDWVDLARAASPSGEGFDVVVDAAGRWQESLACLRPGGRLVVLGASAKADQLVNARQFYFGQYEIIGTTMGSPADFASLVAFADEHRLPPPVIERSFNLADAGEAHSWLESGQGFGKIVLTMDK